jgi:hypothetical protein
MVIMYRPLIKIGLLFLVFVLFGSNWFPQNHGYLGRTPVNTTRGSVILSFADGSNNVTELGHSVHTYPYSLNNQSQPDSDGNYIGAFVFGFGYNPLYNNDPNYDYYIFDIFAYANAGYTWSLDTGGLNDPGGPSLDYVGVFADCAMHQSIVPAGLSPSGTVKTYESEPETVGFNAGFGGFSFGLSDTFYPGQTVTDVYSQNSCGVYWQSGLSSGNTANYYQFHFAVILKVPKNQQPILSGEVKGSFYNNCGLFGCTYDYANSSFGGQFSMPPYTEITSSPAGVGYIEVNGVAETSPYIQVWEVGSMQTITASPYVEEGLGTRYIFSSWNDSGAQSHNIMIESVPITYVAQYTEQHELNISTNGGGTTNLGVGAFWFDASSMVTVDAIPQAGYSLHNWVLDGVDEGNASQITISMDKPHSLSEVFVSGTTSTTTSSSTTIMSNLTSTTNASASTIPQAQIPTAASSSPAPSISPTLLLATITVVVVVIAGVLATLFVRRRS